MISTDSAYSSLSNMQYITNNGINITMGRNKRHVNKSIITKNASDVQLKSYALRTKSENFFGQQN